MSALEYYTAYTGQESAMSPNIATSFQVVAEAKSMERPPQEYLAQLVAAGVTAGGGDPSIDYCPTSGG